LAILHALALLLAFQLAGEATVFALALPVPGPVLGMVLLLGAVAAVPGLPSRLKPTTGTLLTHLSLLFVPAGVGVMVHGARLAAEGVAIVVAIVVSTVLALAATALTVKALLREDEPPDGARRADRDTVRGARRMP
jgi:holin-like protein